MALLEVSDVVSGYGQTEILHGVSLTVDHGEIVTIIGPNGCGKSTLLKTVVGLVSVWDGAVNFRGRDISSSRPEQIARTGLCFVPQSRNVFPTLSIRENLEMGAFLRKDDFDGRIEEMYRFFPALALDPGRRGGSLSGGQRQMLAIARALMLDPTLILLDEPFAGLAPAMVDLVLDRILEINRGGVSVLLVEQNARQALSVSNRGYILVSGENRLEDKGSALLDNPEVSRLYLGG